jgi:hypothetical protein
MKVTFLKKKKTLRLAKPKHYGKLGMMGSEATVITNQSLSGRLGRSYVSSDSM